VRLLMRPLFAESVLMQRAKRCISKRPPGGALLCRLEDELPALRTACPDQLHSPA